MGPTDIVISIILLLVLGGAIAYVIRTKKSGAKCIGCPYAKQCGGKCGCSLDEKDEEK